jgi:MFS family permease
MLRDENDAPSSAAGPSPAEAPPLIGYETPDESRPASAAPTEIQLESESPGGSASAGHDPYAALRYRDYRLFVGGWVASVIGAQIQDVAIGWEIFKRLGSDVSKGSWALGWVGGVQALPVILLALPAGQMADRLDRRKIILYSTLLAALSSFGLALVSYGNGGIGWLYVLLGLGAVAKAIGWPARSALLPQTVPTEVFSNAATWNSSAFQIASVVGPALGGLLVAVGAKTAVQEHGGPGTWMAYCLDACCSLTFCAFLMILRVRSRPQGGGSFRPSRFASLMEGIRYVFNTEMILATITLDLFAVLLGGATFLLPVFAEKRLGVGAVGLGWLRAAPAVGALIMGVTVAHLPPMKRAGRAMLWAVAGFGATTVVFGLSRSFTLSLFMLALIGAFDNVSVIVRHTLVQVMTPDRMRGRVSAVNNIFVGASNELGGFESGLTSWLWGPVISVVGGGIGTILVVVAAALAWPSVRKLGSLQDAVVKQEAIT